MGWILYISSSNAKGVPVATVAINGGENAGLLAVQILSVKYPELRENLRNIKTS